MKFVKDLRTIMLVTLFFVWFPNSVNAKILWGKDLVDTNTNSVPLASCLNKDVNGIIVMTRECPKGEHPVSGGDLALWEIGIDGSATRTEPKDASGNRIWTDVDYIGFGCKVGSDKFGNFLIVGLNKPGEKRQKIAVVSKADKAKIALTPNSIESRSMMKMIPLQDNTFVLVGKRESDGFCLRIDNNGRVLQEKLFDLGNTEMFSGADKLKSDDSTLAVVGLSANLSMNDYHKNYAESFILIYDPNLILVHEDHFANENSVSMFSLLPPKVCCLNNGNIAVLYKKENADPNKTLLWVRCYTKELKLLWDKEIFVADKQPFAMDITARDSGGFTVGVIQSIVQQSNSLELDSFDDEGGKINQINHKGIIGIGGFNLMHLNDKVMAVFEEGTQGNIKESSVKTKVIALD